MARLGVAALVVVAASLLVMVAVVDAQYLSRDANSAAAFLAPHNAARRKVSVPALTWNANLARYARNYALSQRARCVPLRHSRGPYGENLFWGSGKPWTPLEAVTMWVNEGRDYRHSSNSCNAGKMCGHYTQVVWRRTKEVGCASVLCNSGAVYIICSYNPPGNYIGQRPY